MQNNMSREEIRIAKVILSTERDVVGTDAIASVTGLTKKRVEGRLELLSKRGLVGKVGYNSSGSYVMVNQGHRIRLEDLVREHGETTDESAPSVESAESPDSIESSESLQISESAEAQEPIESSEDLRLGKSAEDLEPTENAFDSSFRLGQSLELRRESNHQESCLRVDSYANALAKFIVSAKEQVELCFGLFGHWGRGKTFLMDKTCELLVADNEYSVVRFDAWKYRSQQEVWAHLFRQFYDAAKKDTPLLNLKAAIVRDTPWPIIGTLWITAILWILGYVAGNSIWLLQTVGLAAVVFVLSSIWKFTSLGLRIRSKLKFSGHDETLGLQAAIGKDLSALLCAWIPRRDTGEKRNILNLVLQCFAYSAGAILLIAYSWGTLEILVAQDVSNSKFEWGRKVLQPTTPWLGLAFYGAVLTLLVIGPFVLCWRKDSQKRVLLVIDDLDRCEPEIMLEIVESSMLLLDDDEVKKRVQIVMLIEEDSLIASLEQKYEHLWDADEENGPQKRDELVRENIEKIFLAYLRLPPLIHTEHQQILNSFIGNSLDAEGVVSLRCRLRGVFPIDCSVFLVRSD